MATIKDILEIDLDQMKASPLKERLVEFIKEYDEFDDKEVFEKETKDSINSLLSMVKKYAPEAISKKESSTKNSGSTTVAKKDSNKKMSGKDGGANEPKDVKESKESKFEEPPKELEQDLKAFDLGLDECRRRVREDRARKRAAAPPKPKETRLTKLRKKVLSISKLCPDHLKGDLAVQERDKAFSLEILSHFVESWGMSSVKAEYAKNAIKAEFDNDILEIMEADEEKEAKKFPHAFVKYDPHGCGYYMDKGELGYLPMTTEGILDFDRATIVSEMEVSRLKEIKPLLEKLGVGEEKYKELLEQFKDGKSRC